MLYASLTASLFSAFLAMLGKQWLNRYMSTDMCGTAIERSQNRQRKLNGMVTWHFEHLMESLPLILQVALLLLGCALSRYLWEIDAAIASVIIGVTSFGVLFYLFILMAGIPSESCPYQTPVSRGLRSAASAIASSTPALRLGRAVVHPSVASAHRLYTRLFNAPSTPGHGLDQKTTLLDLQCISWILKTSLNKAVHLSTLESLATMAVLARFDPTLVTDCLDILIGCVKVVDGSVVVTQESEQLATASAMCLLRTFSHLSVTDPKSSALGDVRHHYSMVFLPNTSFEGLPFHHTLGAIHRTFHPNQNYPWPDWGHYKPSSYDHKIFAHALAGLTWSEYQRGENSKEVPAWVLRFVLHSLSLDPPPSTSVTINCLLIIAIDLGCDISSVGIITPDEWYVYILQILISLT